MTVKFNATRKLQHYYIRLLYIKCVRMHKIVEVFNFAVLMHRQIKSSIENSTYTVPCQVMFCVYLCVQGKMMGILTAAGSLSRVVGPMFVTFIYDKLGPQIAFATIDGIIATAIILLMILYYRLVPYGQHWGF